MMITFKKVKESGQPKRFCSLLSKYMNIIIAWPGYKIIYSHIKFVSNIKNY